ncbi:MAG: hypothetical protein NC344_04645 [Bacteroidales bacterium]|nr:hypothetical protein [Bacteroidales bacterium]MCM1147114.1 hypothetical protein [Bacteroidales bacterium]MCM1205752.1 hypothetical protein [Bacillota bacterium]MCM1511143.1 hypothetical protein [Clostridium sp.]
MKKLFTLIVAFVATLSAMAQMHGALKFIGNGEFYLPMMQEQTYTQTLKDVVTVNMSETQSFDIPSMAFDASGMGMGVMTITSFNVPGLTYTLTGSYQEGNMEFEWNGANISTVAKDATGAEKAVTVTNFHAAYNHVQGKLNVSLSFKYGAMPFELYYAAEAYYTKDNAFGLVGQGTQGNPYRIYEPSDFMAIANGISAENTFDGVYFEQMNDIDFGGTEAAPVQFPAIGKAAITSITSVAWGFDGTYDGRYKSIKGIYHTANANDADGKFNALFSSVGTKGTVKNLVFDVNNHVSSYNYVGTIASINKGLIENCTNKADITASNAFASGICAYMIGGVGTVRTCENFGNVKAMTYATGIIAGTQSGAAVTSYDYLVEKCTNNGNISSTNGTGSAGIAGSYSGALRECTNNGNVDDTAKTTGLNTGGILSAGAYITEMTKCHNTGVVSGNKSVGGIIGTIMKGDDTNLTITDCHNDGDVKATGVNVAGVIANTARVAGIVTIDNCSNYGHVESTGTTDLLGNLRGNEIIVVNNCTIGSSLDRLPLDPAQTGIADVNVADAAGVKDGKYIRNGRIVIVKGGNSYSVTGIKY